MHHVRQAPTMLHTCMRALGRPGAQVTRATCLRACRGCKRMAAHWDELAEALARHSDDTVIARQAGATCTAELS